MFRFVECRHILPTGRKCHSPALRGKSYCYHHTKLHFRRWGSRQPRMLKTLALDDPRSLRTAVVEALTALHSPLTDPKKAAVILYGLNLAHNLSRQMQGQSEDVERQPNEAHHVIAIGHVTDAKISQKVPETSTAKMNNKLRNNHLCQHRPSFFFGVRNHEGKTSRCIDLVSNP